LPNRVNKEQTTTVILQGGTRRVRNASLLKGGALVTLESVWVRLRWQFLGTLSSIS
jgi:hypothetical protein